MPGPALYVADFRGATISVVDVEAATLDRTISMGTAPVGGSEVPIQVDSFDQSDDPSLIYMSRFPEGPELSSIPGGRPAYGDVIALDTRDDAEVWAVPIAGKPNHISATRDGRLIYVPVRDRAHVDVLDTQAREVVAKINCGWGPHSTALSVDENLLYVGTMWQDTLDVLDVRERRRIMSVPLGEAVRPFAVTADDAVAYVQLSRLHGFVVVDLKAGRRVQTVHLPEIPLGTPIATTYTYNIDHGLAIRHSKSELWVAGTPTNYVAVYDLPALKLKRIIDVGRGPAYVTFSKDEALCFVSNRDDDTVSILDAENLTEAARVPVGDYPNRMKYVEVPNES